MATDLALLRVSDPRGKSSREIVVSESTTMFNLHRVLQFCIKEPYKFTHVASGKKVGKPKKTQLYRANQFKNTAELAVGDAYKYEADTWLKGGGKESYLVEIIDVQAGDARYDVPRCISGNTDLEPINRKLLLRRFPKSGGMTPKKPPAVWCRRDTPYEVLMQGHLSAMKDPLGSRW